MKRYPDSMPYAWLSAKFSQLHLDVYVHNFSLIYSFQEQKVIIIVTLNKINDIKPSILHMYIYAKFYSLQDKIFMAFSELHEHPVPKPL